MMQLFGSSNSGHSYKVKLFLTLANIRHQYIWVDLSLTRANRQKDFIVVSKFNEVPVLLDQGTSYCQSNSILQYISQKYNIFNGNINQLSQINEWLFWETNRIGFSLPNYRFHKIWDKQPKDVMQYLLNRTLNDLKILDDALIDKQFLVGDQFTIADISCCAYLYWLKDVEINIQNYPNLKRWLDRIESLPHWQSADHLLKAI